MSRNAARLTAVLVSLALLAIAVTFAVLGAPTWVIFGLFAIAGAAMSRTARLFESRKTTASAD